MAILLSARTLICPDDEILQARLQYHILHLENFLIRGINAALSDPARATSDQLAVTIGLLAAYDLKRGSIEGYHIHMQGLVRMVGARGGLTQMGMTDPYLERYMIWHVSNLARLAGSDSYFQQMDESTIARPVADEEMFRAREVCPMCRKRVATLRKY